ncbi:TIGR04255 family protein [uncultured Bifidobacterium sp.]|uniref:TIGR04255 family protein n=1 Tax=uncultured Bifidobacterium sp. TaxID=165187 RepID=UPI002596ECDF|nr:TIGR04255 family protein [uncultured Bifidobacterium sp.]
MNEEIYPNAPIVLMVAEIKHTEHGPLDERQIRRMTEAVKETLPIREEDEERNPIIIGAPDNSQPSIEVAQTKVMRWSSRDKRTIIKVKPDAISVETTQYHRYADIRQLLENALHALADTVAVDGVTRIGLRYIDEIRVPSEGDSGLPDWGEWVDRSLLGPSGVEVGHGLAPAANTGTTVFSDDGEMMLVLRYGAQDAYVIGSTPQLRRPLPSPGPLFKLDIDSYWQPEDVPEFDPDDILARSDKLHEPVRSMFEGLITDKLRNEVLRRG